MNWYKRLQYEKYAGKGLWTAMGLLTIPAIIALIGANAYTQLKDNPQELVKQVQQAQQVQTSEPNKIRQTPEPNLPTTEPNQPVVEPSQSMNIDIDKIWQIESSRGTDPKMGGSPAGARGHFQFMKDTWDECVRRMGKDWDWENGSMDYEKSSQVADFYLNKRIPQMLNYYKIPDTTETRLGTYDWGISGVKEAWEEHGEDWLEYSPRETQDYIRKYR